MTAGLQHTSCSDISSSVIFRVAGRTSPVLDSDVVNWFIREQFHVCSFERCVLFDNFFFNLGPYEFCCLVLTMVWWQPDNVMSHLIGYGVSLVRMFEIVTYIFLQYTTTPKRFRRGCGRYFFFPTKQLRLPSLFSLTEFSHQAVNGSLHCQLLLCSHSQALWTGLSTVL